MSEPGIQPEIPGIQPDLASKLLQQMPWALLSEYVVYRQGKRRTSLSKRQPIEECHEHWGALDEINLLLDLKRACEAKLVP